MTKNYLLKLKKLISFSPSSPGVYQMKNKKGEVIYIGKAKNLKKRLSSYLKIKNNNYKTEFLLKQTDSINFLTTNNEYEALILESNLIKKNKPKYNIKLKDDKNYPFIMIDKTYNYPRLKIVRKIKKDNNIYLGPFALVGSIHKITSIVNNIFHLRHCSNYKFKHTKKPCIQYQMNHCDAPCIKKVSIKKYNYNLKEAISFLQGDVKDVIQKFSKKMLELASKEYFEEAAELRNYINKLTKLSSISEEKTDLNTILIKIKKKCALKKIPSHIECIDLSHFGGKQSTGSLVTFIDGKPQKNFYRRYKIKTKALSDDYAMLKEVLERRFSHSEKNFPHPDLLLIDGGKGQLSIASKAALDFKLNFDIISIAKSHQQKPDYIYIQKRKNPIIFKKGDLSILYLQKIRDEAHRFAVSYHKKLRKNSLISD